MSTNIITKYIFSLKSFTFWFHCFDEWMFGNQSTAKNLAAVFCSIHSFSSELLLPVVPMPLMDVTCWCHLWMSFVPTASSSLYRRAAKSHQSIWLLTNNKMKLVKFLQKLNREQVTIELKNGTVISGTVVGVDATMNAHLKKAKMTARGKNPVSYATLSVRGSTVRDWILPDGLNLDALLVEDAPKVRCLLFNRLMAASARCMSLTMSRLLSIPKECSEGCTSRSGKRTWPGKGRRHAWWWTGKGSW